MDIKYISPTPIIDSDNRQVIDYAMKKTEGCKEQVDQAVKIFYAVRDEILYDPYHAFYLPEHHRASSVLKSKRGYCVCKASLLCALGRVLKIPSRIGFASIINHLASKQFTRLLGTNLFVYHGYTEFYLQGKWVKATPAFNSDLCKKNRLPLNEFNGYEDCIFSSCDLDKKPFMEYVKNHGVYADVPVNTILDAWKETYGEDRVNKWIDFFEKSGEISAFGLIHRNRSQVHGSAIRG